MELDTKKIIEALKKLDMPEYRDFDDKEKEVRYSEIIQDLEYLAETDAWGWAAFALSVFSAIVSEKENWIMSLKKGDLVFNGLKRRIETFSHVYPYSLDDTNGYWVYTEEYDCDSSWFSPLSDELLTYIQTLKSSSSEKEDTKETENYGFGLGKPVEIIHSQCSGHPATTRIWQIN